MNEENLTPHTTHGEVIDLKNVWGWKQVANEPHEFWQRDFAAGTVGAMIVWWNGIYGGWQIEEVEMLEEVARTLNDKKLAAGYVVLIDDKGEVCAAADVLRVIENCKNAKLSCSYFWINKEFMPVAEPAINISGEEVLKRVWEDQFAGLPAAGWFTIDDSLPATVVHEARELELTPVQVCAALDYWRSTVTQAVDEVAVRYKQQAQQACDEAPI
jgi:hypothetical protein